MRTAPSRRGLYALVAANAVSHLGNVVAVVALPWFVLSTPDLRARAFAILLAAEMMVVPVSMLLYGFLLEAGGLRAGLLLFAGGNALLAAYAVANQPARRLEPARGAA
jgi:hypothetical protein